MVAREVASRVAPKLTARGTARTLVVPFLVVLVVIQCCLLGADLERLTAGGVARLRNPGSGRSGSSGWQSKTAAHIANATSSHMCHSHDFSADSSKHISCEFRNLCILRNSTASNFHYYDDALTWHYLRNDGLTAPNFTVGIGPHSLMDQLIVHPRTITPADFFSRVGGEAAVNRIEGTSVVYHEYNGENFGHVLTDAFLVPF